MLQLTHYACSVAKTNKYLVHNTLPKLGSLWASCYLFDFYHFIFPFNCQIVDLALLVKKDTEESDVLAQVMPPVSILSESQSSIVTPGTSAPSTPSHTPPDTPTTPTIPFLPSPGSNSASSTSQNSSLVAKPKSKKRKLKASIESKQQITKSSKVALYTTLQWFEYHICMNNNIFSVNWRMFIT